MRTHIFVHSAYLLLLVVVSAVIMFFALATPALAGSKPTLNWGKETNAAACDTSGKPVINVTHKVENDSDSGFNGYWAKDAYTRSIQVWQTGEDTYCAVTRYKGQFDAFDGANSPGQVVSDDGVLEGDERGTFQGGYRALITGTLNPTESTHGSIGTKDYMCDENGSCVNVFNWLDAYFDSGWTFAYDWWGWIYHGGKYGTWVNAVTGSSGDID